MKITKQIFFLSVALSTLLFAGCSQSAKQPIDPILPPPQPIVEPPPPLVTPPPIHREPKTIIKHIVDCNQCKRPAPRPVPRPRPRPQQPKNHGSCHVHAAIPGCTNSIKHCHASNNPNHKHKYSCRNQRPAQRPIHRPRPTPRPQPPAYRPRPTPYVPQVKAKGHYRGPVMIDKQMMNQYQQ